VKKLLLLAVFLCAGCAGTLEESRAQANLQTVAGVPVSARSSGLCSRYSNVEYGARLVAGPLAVLAGASGLTTWPVHSSKWETRLEVGAAVTGTASVVSYGIANQQASKYIESGCAK
jgi:hypothetical protein